MESFSHNLRYYRKKSGYSSNELAELLNIPYTTFKGYENAGREPKYETLCRIANILKVSTDELLGNIDSLYVYTEKEEDINKITKGMDLSEIDQNYETYSDLRDLLDDANNAGELVLKQQYFDTFYVAEIDQSKNKLVGINKYKISVKIEKVE